MTLTFAGEDKLSATTSEVNKKLGETEEAADEAGAGYERASEAGEVAEQRTQGFADTLDGATQVAGGFSQIMKGDVVGGFITVGAGLASLAGGFNDFLLPALKASKIATLAQAAASKVAAAGTAIWEGAQWLLNTAFLASPIGWIVLGIAALIAVIVLIATKTTWFQTIWTKAWAGIKIAASAVWSFIKQIPGWTASAFGKIASVISAPYRAAFNLIASAWNATVGSLHWSVPSWVPGIGGDSISVPKLPHFHTGGTVPGPAGSEVLAVLKAGETVSANGSSGSQAAPVYVRGDGVVDALVEAIATAVGKRGGRPAALGLKG